MRRSKWLLPLDWWDRALIFAISFTVTTTFAPLLEGGRFGAMLPC